MVDHLRVLEQHIIDLHRLVGFAIDHRQIELMNDVSRQLVNAVEAYDRILARNRGQSINTAANGAMNDAVEGT